MVILDSDPRALKSSPDSGSTVTWSPGQYLIVEEVFLTYNPGGYLRRKLTDTRC